MISPYTTFDNSSMEDSHLHARLFIVRYVEHFLPFISKADGLISAHSHLMEEVIWPRFWSIQIWLLVLFFAFASLHELVRLIGRDRVLHMFFGSPIPAKP